MKKLLCLILVMCICLSLCNSFVAMAQITDPFEGKTDIVISTIGGSLTAGDGSDYVQAWAQSLANNYLPNKYPGKNFILKNAGIGGTTSEFGTLRFDTDVAPHNPDMVFIEFSVNDKWFPVLGQTEDMKRNLESLIQQCKELPSKPYVAFVLLTTWENTKDAGDIHKQIADYYGIPVFDLRSYIHDEVLADGGDYDYCALCQGKSAQERLACPNHDAHGRCPKCYNKSIEEALVCPDVAKHSLFYKISNDGTHPGNEGYQIYYHRITQLLDESPEIYYKKPADVPLLYTDTTPTKGLLNLTTNNFTNILKSSDWVQGTSDYIGPTGSRTNTYITSTLGAKLNFKFHGNTLCFFAFRGSDLGSYRVTIDKGTANEVTKEFTQYFETSLGYGSKAQQTVSLGGLTNDWHTAEIENIQNQGVPSNQSAVLKNQTVLAYYITNSDISVPTVSNIYADGTPLDLTSSNQAKFPLGIQTIDVEFNGLYDNMDDSKISLTCGGLPVDYTGSYNSELNKYTFNLANPIEIPSSSYDITLSGALTFNGVALGNDVVYTLNSGNGVKLLDLKFTDANGGQLVAGQVSSVKFSFKASNLANSDPIDFLAILAYKSSDGIMKMVDVKKASVIQGESGILEPQLALNNIEAGDYCQLFILQDGVLSPFTKDIKFMIDDLRITSIGDNIDYFNVNNIALRSSVSNVESQRTDTNIITVNGNTTGDIVTVKVANKAGDIVYIDSCGADNGAFQIQCKIRNLAEETHTVSVSSN